MTATTPIEQSPPPPREKFKEAALPAEPDSDVKLTTDSGMVLRERVARFDGEGCVTLQFTYTRLDENDAVMLDRNEAPMIFSAHDVVMMGEGVGRVGVEGIKSTVKMGREVGAARAVAHFEGLALLGDLMASRLTEPMIKPSRPSR